MAGSAATIHFRFWLWLIALAGVIVPRRLRAGWRQEWEAELSHREQLLAEWDRLDWRNKLDLLRRSFGAFTDALLLQPRRMEDEMFQDLRFGLRVLFKQKIFSVVAVLTLALGIGATTAIFTVVNGVLLRSLPYAEPERLVRLKDALKTYGNWSDEQYKAEWKYRFDWVARLSRLRAVSAYSAGDGGVNLSGLGEPARIEAVEVSANFFQTLGVQPVLGRAFVAEEEQPGRQLVALISYELWQQRLGGALDVVGRSCVLNGKSFTIIGVAPPHLRFPRKADCWIPLAPSPWDRVMNNTNVSYALIGRLQNGVTAAEAQDELIAVTNSLRPPSPAGTRLANTRTPSVALLLDYLVGDFRKALWLLFGAVGLVLLIACANVANLLLALAAARRRELAVRAALGAGRFRLLRQMLTESCVLALLGGLLGVWLAQGLMRALTWLSPPQMPRLDELRLDYRVLGFAFAASLLTGVITGALPAWRSSNVDLNEALKDGGRSTASGGRRVRGALVVAQVALSFVLLVGAGLLMRSFINVLNVQSGFATENLMTVSLSLPRARYESATAAREFTRQLLDRLQSQPHWQTVAAANKLPLGKTEIMGLLFEVEGVTPSANFNERFALFNSTSPGYFNALGIRLLQGRDFSATDTANAPPVIIINERMALRYFAPGQALGRRIKVTGEKQPREIVGIVNDMRSLDLEEAQQQEMYLPYLQGGPPATTLALKTALAPAAALRLVQQTVHSLDKDLPLFNVKTMRQQVYDSIARRSYLLWLMSALALLGLWLTAAGLYGVIAYSVTQRTHEIGIRMALGASSRSVVALVLRETGWLVGMGLLVGLAATWLAARLVASLLYGLGQHDPLTLTAAAGLMLSVALLASWWPARRATQVDPLAALRHE